MAQWYPGHIAKTEKELKEQLKLMDVVIEVRDARIPLSTTHPQVSFFCHFIIQCLPELTSYVLTAEFSMSTDGFMAWSTKEGFSFKQRRHDNHCGQECLGNVFLKAGDKGCLLQWATWDGIQIRDSL